LKKKPLLSLKKTTDSFSRTRSQKTEDFSPTGGGEGGNDPCFLKTSRRKKESNCLKHSSSRAGSGESDGKHMEVQSDDPILGNKKKKKNRKYKFKQGASTQLNPHASSKGEPIGLGIGEETGQNCVGRKKIRGKTVILLRKRFMMRSQFRAKKRRQSRGRRTAAELKPGKGGRGDLTLRKKRRKRR